ncbi:hypothetical protein [Treponema bryantii]|uniref:hypothetical protein n=1 Tax=Treponema bryantii TaxID=163 RepID=UPI0003B33D9D|nr:hypothetical protein [Treponema bryantii]
MAYLYFSISNSVTQEEWTKVYEETLVLANKIYLTDWEKFYYKGVGAYAFCKVKEHTNKYFGEKTHFWQASSDYNYMNTGDIFRLKREIDNYDENAAPAILEQLYLSPDVRSKIYENQIRQRGLRIYGDTYYIRLLAILCFMESKLKEKIFICGDFDREDCEKAVKIVNNILDEQIELPARCDFNRLYSIVRKTDISEEEKIYLMEKTYLGNINFYYKELIEEKFGRETLNNFWKYRFKEYEIGSYNFQQALEAYFSYGLAFKDLIKYIQLNNTKEDYLKLLKSIIEAENNRDRYSRNVGISRDPKNNIVHGFSLGFSHSLFGPDTTDSFIFIKFTIDDYINELSKYFDSQIDIRNFLLENIKEEDEVSFENRLRECCHKDSYVIFDGEKDYDIFLPQDLIYYKIGDRIAPYLLDKIQNVGENIKNKLEDKEFKEISQKETTDQIYELIDIDYQFPARDIDWVHAIDYFNTHSDALERYYPLFRMQPELISPAEEITKAIFINDAFYDFCKNLWLSVRNNQEKVPAKA